MLGEAMADNPVEKWLAELGLNHLIGSFREQRIDADALLYLDDNHFIELGITAVGDRAKIRRKVSEHLALVQQNMFSNHAGGMGGSSVMMSSFPRMMPNQMPQHLDGGAQWAAHMQGGNRNLGFYPVHGSPFGFNGGLQGHEPVFAPGFPVVGLPGHDHLIKSHIQEDLVEDHSSQPASGTPSKRSKNLMCNLCQEAFPSQQALKAHFQEVHPSASSKHKSFKCSYCERYFPTKDKCQGHEEKVHVDKPAPFKCAFCARGFAWSVTRVKHESTCPSRLDAVNNGAIMPGSVTRDRNEQDSYKERLKARWDQMYEELKQYKDEYGSCAVPQGWVQNKPLASWVSSQRQNRRKGLLEPDKQRLLEDVGFIWIPRANNKMSNAMEEDGDCDMDDPQTSINKHRRWHVIFLQLKNFRQTFGHCTPSGDSLLGAWSRFQRWQRKANKMGMDKIKLLTDEGFVWECEEDAVVEQEWDACFARLREYHGMHGDCNVPKVYEADEKLGKWVYYQRICKAEMFDSHLTPERLRALEELGFVWENNSVEGKKTWNQRFEELKEYRDKFGHCGVPGGWWENPQLAQWVEKMRWIGGTGGLKESQVKALEELGFQWESLSRKLAWDSFFQELCDFKAQHGHLDVPLKHNRRLTRWMRGQRDAKAEGKIKEDRERRLEELGFAWQDDGPQGRQAPAESWDENLEMFAEHAEVYPCEDPSGGMLRCWVRVQREIELAGRMDADRRKQLDDVGFLWTPPRGGVPAGLPVGRKEETDEWVQRIEQLKHYKSLHGHCDPHSSSMSAFPGLSDWLIMQRLYAFEGLDVRLSVERQQQLDNIGIAWTSSRNKSTVGMPKRAGTSMDWEERYAELAEFHRLNGHINVPSDHRSPAQLPSFLSQNRMQRNAGTLDENRLQRLDDLGFDWENPADRLWEDRLAELTRFKARFGHLATQINPDYKKITMWLKHQRAQERVGKLIEKRRKPLLELGVLLTCQNDASLGEKRDGLDLDGGVPRTTGNRPKKYRKTRRPAKGDIFDVIPGDENISVMGDMTESDNDGMDS